MTATAAFQQAARTVSKRKGQCWLPVSLFRVLKFRFVAESRFRAKSCQSIQYNYCRVRAHIRPGALGELMSRV